MASYAWVLLFATVVAAAAFPHDQASARIQRDLENPPVRQRRFLENPPVRQKRDLEQPPVRQRRNLEQPPVRNRRGILDFFYSSVESHPPVSSWGFEHPPVRSRRDVQPPVRSRRDVQPPVRRRRDVQPPVRSRRDVQPPVRRRRDVQSEKSHSQFLKVEANYEDVYVADFEGLAAEFVKKQEQQNGKVLWYDLYASRPEMEQYQEYQVNVKVGETRWEDATVEYNFPGYTYSQSYENYGSEPLESVFSKTADVPDYFSWTMNKGVNVQAGFNFSIGIPPIFDITLDLEGQFYLDVTRTTTETEIETYSVSHTITVPPGKGVKAEYVVEDHAMSVPWTADVLIDGYIAIWYEEQVNEHWLWFYPVNLLANDEFVEYEDGVKVETGGYFLGSEGVDDYIDLEEYWLDETANATPTKKSEQRPTVKHGL